MIETRPLEDRTVAEETYRKDKTQGVEYKEAFQQGANTTKYEVELHGDEKHAPARFPSRLLLSIKDVEYTDGL